MKRKILKSEKFPIYRHTTIISGAKISRDIVHRPDIAAILAYKDGHILVVSHNRFPNQTDIEIPSGNMEKNEKPIACAFREFEEETGYQSKKMIPFFSFYTSIGYSTQRVNCFIAKDFEKNGKQNLDDDEMLQVKKIQFKKLLKMALNGKIIDSITLSSVLLFAIKKKLI